MAPGTGVLGIITLTLAAGITMSVFARQLIQEIC